MLPSFCSVILVLIPSPLLTGSSDDNNSAQPVAVRAAAPKKGAESIPSRVMVKPKPRSEEEEGDHQKLTYHGTRAPLLVDTLKASLDLNPLMDL